MKEVKGILEKANFEELAELSKYLKIENGDIYEIRNKFKDNNTLLITKIIEYLQYSSKGIFDKIFQPGQEISYREILTNILEKFEISYNNKLSVVEFENKILSHFLDYIDKFSKEEKEQIILKLNNKDIEKILDKINQSNNVANVAGVEIGTFLLLINKLLENIGENYSKLIPSILLLIKLRLKYNQ